MKIIEPGRDQKGWAAEFRCTGGGNTGGGCEALLLVEEGDLKAYVSNALHEVTHYVSFDCPSCGVRTDVYNSEHGTDATAPPQVTRAVLAKAKARRDADG